MIVMMGPRTDSMSFEPTPALEENKENCGPFGNDYSVKHCDDPDEQNKSVRFSDFPTITSPARRAQSIATSSNIPLLEPISSASHLPRQSFRFRNAVPEIDMEAYIEHTRSVIEGQREGFEREKAAFDRERKMWDVERGMLKSRIANLEFKLNKTSDGKRRYSNEPHAAPGLPAFRSTFASFSGVSNNTGARLPSQEKERTTPVWEGPETTAPVTRVFSNEDQKPFPTNHLPSISEDEPLPAAETSPDPISPRTEQEPTSISIKTIDSNLDGITLKSTALAPSFVARIASGDGSPAHSASPQGRAVEGNLQIEMTNLLSPLDEKLKKHAGHTPMAFGTNGASTGGSTTEQVTPKLERPAAPAPSARPPLRPAENSDSYFSFSHQSTAEKEEEKVESKRRVDVRRGTVSNTAPIFRSDDSEELDDDPALQGPLMLDPAAKLKTSDSFLDLVDAKLNEEIRHHPEASEEAEQTSAIRSDSEESASKSDGYEKEHNSIADELEMPRLKIKRSMNFGSAWGSGGPGRHLS